MRGKKQRDRRGPLASVGPQRDRWKCFPCDESGDSIDLVALLLKGRRVGELDADDRREVREWHVDHGFLAPLDRDAPRSAARPTPAPPAPPAPPPAPVRPDVQELALFWKRSIPLAEAPFPGRTELDEATIDFLRKRGFWRLRASIARADLARLTPPPEAGRGNFPRWWPHGRARTWRLLIRAWTVDGHLASVHGRAVVPPPTFESEQGSELTAAPKVLWPKHPDKNARYDHARLLFANVNALAVLRRRPLPGPVVCVLILEGLTDWLAAAAHVAALEERLAAVAADHPRIAVLGGVSGSFPALADVAWPETVQAFLTGVDDDAAGRRYALELVRALSPHPVRPLPLASLMEQIRG